MQTYFIAIGWNNRPVSLHFRTLANELAALGHRVVLLVPGNLRHVYSPSTNPAVLNWPSARPRHFRDAVFLFRLVRNHHPDCLIANFSATNVMTLVGYLMRVRVRINWYHTLSTQTLADNPISWLRRRFLLIRKSFIHRLATHVVPVSSAANEDLQKVFRVPADKCHLFYNSLADPLADKCLPSASGDRLICIGRLFPSKGQDVVIKAIAILKKTLPGVRVEFVGNGPSKDFLFRLVSDYGLEDMCSFEDSALHSDVLARMSASAATLVPSRSDNCPLVAIESLAVGTPLIASAVGGITEIVRDKVDGFLVSPDDPESLAEKIKAFLTDPVLRQSMRSSARERFLTRFERRNNIAEQLKWFQSLIAS